MDHCVPERLAAQSGMCFEVRRHLMCHPAALDTVARPMWLSGIRKAEATLLSTPIWWRTCMRSARVAGSTSQTTRNLATPRAYEAGRRRRDNATGGGRTADDSIKRPGGSRPTDTGKPCDVQNQSSRYRLLPCA
jgi:hypothetical protein